jgi:hypothetical protein
MSPLRPYVPSYVPTKAPLSLLLRFLPATAYGSSTALYPLYGALILSMALCPLRPSVPSTVLCPLFSSLSPLRHYVPFTRPLSSLWTSVFVTAIFPLYGPLFLLLPSVLFTVLCLLQSNLSPLHTYVPSTALCSLLRYLVPSMACCPF